MTAGFFTLGCKLNQYETEGIADSFKNLGITVIPALRSLDEQADLYIINTCTVTSKSEQKARRVIRKLLKDHPGARVIVTGCYAQVDAESLKNIDSRVRVVPQDDKPSLLTLASSLLDREPEAVPGKFDYMPSSYSFHTRAFLKIQDGCDNFCSYCRVPFARGASVSSPSARVLERAGVLAAKGFGEIVITGVNISAFRDPEKPDYGLPRLIENLAASVPGVRLRVSSLEPESINEELLAVLMHPTICPHFHLPVQSGSDAVLRRMARRYSAAAVGKAVRDLRNIKTDPFIAADVIAGFPGETEQDFRETLELITRCGFSRLHVFPFSRRPGTRANVMPGQVPSAVIKGRTRQLLEISEKLYDSYVRRWVGKEADLLLQEKQADGAWTGVSGNYLSLTAAGLPENESAPQAGGIVRVLIESWDGSTIKAGLPTG